MSHFLVMVVGEDIEKALAPYQEGHFEAEFVETETESLADYKTKSARKFRSPSGEIFNPWDEKFRVPGTYGSGGDTHKKPVDFDEVEVPFTDIYPTFEEYMADWCGNKERDPAKGRYGYWTNPNAKWDWFFRQFYQPRG